ncbi:MAG: carbohydrate kinase family protein [Pirellulaceae bacterium]|nr:carbohydrate kinase family protein [Pirellulaceae bacterium]
MKTIDCVVVGETCIDLLVRPIPREVPLASSHTLLVEPILPGTGGIVPNAGLAMAKLGLAVSAVAVVGSDEWGRVIRGRLTEANIDCRGLVAHPTAPSSVTAVLASADGEHSFAFAPGASALIDKQICLDRLELFAQARFALFGYYHLLPNLQADLPEVLAAVRRLGCGTALDAANGGGTLQPLDQMLPHLDLYVPSLAEARQQTGESDPARMIACYRRHGCTGIVGVKLGSAGALLSPAPGELAPIAPVSPPGPVVDTTGAGDCFYAGLIAGLARGLSPVAAARLGAAAGACSVTGVGAAAVRDFAATRGLAEC